MSGLVHVRSRATEESPIVLVDLILRSRVSSVEASKICPEVGILAHARVDPEAAAQLRAAA